MKIVVINDSFLEDEHIARLEKIGEVELFSKTDTEDLAISRLKGADVVITDMFECPLNGKVFANIPSVKYMTINSTGYDLVDVDAAKKHGVIISHVPGFSTEGVAEHSIALLLAVSRRIARGDKAMREQPFQLDPANRDHDRYLGMDIYGKTLGIIGLGKIGTRLAEIGQALGMKVIAYNRTEKNVPGVVMVSLDELIKKSDVVSINGAPSEEQTNLINEETLGKMKKTAILINTARGDFVDDDALAKALSEQRIAGAGLDFVHNWDANNPLLKLENVVLTPHVGWFTKESLKNMADIIVSNVEAFAAGNPINTVD